MARKKKTVRIAGPGRLKSRSGLHRPTRPHEPAGRYRRSRARAEARKRIRDEG